MCFEEASEPSLPLWYRRVRAGPSHGQHHPVLRLPMAAA